MSPILIIGSTRVCKSILAAVLYGVNFELEDAALQPIELYLTGFQYGSGSASKIQYPQKDLSYTLQKNVIDMLDISAIQGDTDRLYNMAIYIFYYRVSCKVLILKLTIDYRNSFSHRGTGLRSITGRVQIIFENSDVLNRVIVSVINSYQYGDLVRKEEFIKLCTAFANSLDENGHVDKTIEFVR